MKFKATYYNKKIIFKHFYTRNDLLLAFFILYCISFLFCFLILRSIEGITFLYSSLVAVLIYVLGLCFGIYQIRTKYLNWEYVIEDDFSIRRTKGNLQLLIPASQITNLEFHSKKLFVMYFVNQLVKDSFFILPNDPADIEVLRKIAERYNNDFIMNDSISSKNKNIRYVGWIILLIGTMLAVLFMNSKM